jgi:small subunit ribosomal protein S11
MKETKTDNKADKQKSSVRSRKKNQRNVPAGIAHIFASFNNTIVTITDLAGKVLVCFSAGRAGFSGSRKSNVFAAAVAGQEAGKAVILSCGMKEVEVELKGPGAGRESAARGVQSAGLVVTTIRDVTPVAHNGCKARKHPRV